MTEPTFAQTAENLREQIQDLLALEEASRRIQTADGIGAILAETGAALQRIVPKAGRAVYLRTEDGIDFLCHLSAGASGVPGSLISLPLDVVDWVCQERRHSMIPGAGGRAVALLPLLVGQEVVGLMELSLPEGSGAGEALTQKLLAELQYLCGQSAASLLNAVLKARVEAERLALERTGAFLNDILESVNHGILALDPEGRISLVNQNAGSMLQVEAAELKGKPYREAFGEDFVRLLDSLVEQVGVQGFAMDQQLVRKELDGAELSLGIGGTPLMDAKGHPVGTLVICRDMTASKELDRLRALDQMKSQFVSNVSHELRTPLTSIKAYTDAVSGMVTDDTAKHFLKVVDEEADRLLGMIEDLLNVSRIESGKFRLRWEDVDVRAMVQTILELSRVQSQRHNILTSVADAVPATVPMDKNKMKEVLINLVNNAIKYAPDGGDVTVAVQMEEGNLRMDVTDQGMGLSAENQKKLFQMFFRTDQAQASQIRGTGLGLAITKGIVEAHGGAIRVSSEGEGKGSTFTVVMPVRSSAPQD